MTNQSETPRTDQECEGTEGDYYLDGYVDSGFARQLEREVSALTAQLAEARRDGDAIKWLEENHTLHKSVEILYVVDGYEVTLMHEDGVTELSQTVRGNNLREAIYAAMKEPK